MYRRSGFTLIELLIVIGLIVLLGGIALAAVAQAGKQPHTVMCLQNQSSIWKGMMLYVGDNQGVMPRCMRKFLADGTPTWGNDYSYKLPWSNAICRYPASMLHDSVDPPVPPPWNDYSPLWQAAVSYVEEPEVFMCPAADREADFAMWPLQAYGQECTDWFYNVQGTYGLNMRMTTWNNTNHWGVAKPSECYMFADSWIYGFDHIWTGDEWYALRHGAGRGMLNIMFHDGHSETTLEAEIVAAQDCEYGVGTPWWGGSWD